MSRIIFNEDPNHFVYCRDRAGIDVGQKEITDFIEQYRGTQIGDFMVNLNASTAWAPSKARECAIDKYEQALAEGKTVHGDWNGSVGVRLLHDIYKVKHIPMHQEWFRLLRENGIRPWVSIRTNDIHNNDDETNFLHSGFFVGKHHLRRGSHHAATDYYDNALDFSQPEVREHLLSYIAETLDEYDMYGLELDWMREIYSLRIGREVEGTEILTAYMGEIKQAVVKAEAKWGHPIKIGIRVPASPVTCLRLGFDVLEWVERGYLDLLVVTPRWATTDNDMPIDLWKRMLRGKNVELAAGLEILVDPYFTEPNKKFLFQSPETARGSAAAYLSMGVDAVYLFNFMDCVNPDDWKKVTVLDPAVYRQTLSEIGSLDTIGDKPRRHLVTYCDVTAPGVPQKSVLPLVCGKRETGNPAFVGKTRYRTLRIPTGTLPENARLQLVLGLDDLYTPEEDDLDIFVNARKVRFAGEVRLPAPAYPGLRYWCWEIEPEAGFPIASIVEIGAPKNKTIVKWAEIGVNMNYKY